MKLFSLFAFFACAALHGQTFSIGVKGGGLLTDPAGRLDDSRRYLVGASVEIGFHDRMAVEVDALYSRVATRGDRFFPGASVRGHAGQLPVLGKYYFTSRDNGVRPFAAGGVAFRKIWFDLDDRRLGRSSGTSDLGVGAVIGGGVSMRWWRLHFAPEFRYLRWGGTNFPASNRNEAQVLLGVSF